MSFALRCPAGVEDLGFEDALSIGVPLAIREGFGFCRRRGWLDVGWRRVIGGLA